MVLNFLRELRNSFPNAEHTFNNGSCYHLYLIIKTLYITAKPYYSETDGHWITEIDGQFFDIGGQLSLEYVEFKGYLLITDNTILTSASVLGGGSYCKYIER